jgi:signal-transduction protein with cAMP-binding, CBS, and nucleotidyltransferase domain
MQVTATLREPAIRLDQPVRTLLTHKGHEIWATSPQATVLDAIRKMSDKHVGCLLVLTSGQLAGIVTERDYARKVVLEGRSSQQTAVREIMTYPVVTVREYDRLEHAMREMTERRLRHLPVMRGDGIVGVISIGDVLRWVLEAQGRTIRQLEDYINGSYPG